MKPAIIAALALAVPIAAACAVAAGAFDAGTRLRAAGAIAETPAPTIEIAPLDEALTFARLADGTTLAVFSYRNGKVEGAPLAAGEDAISLVARMGYDGARDLIGIYRTRITVDADDLAVPVGLNDRHIAAGTNYRDHADEADVEGGPFLFPKYVAPTSARSAIPAGDALLDYEVELCLVAMNDLPPDEPASGGLILCNDVTDRATLLRGIDPDDPRSGAGFASGKSAPGYLPVGDLFVIPRDLEAFAATVTLQLAVDGAERQRAKATQWIWDFGRILDEARARRTVEWNYWGGVARLPLDEAGGLPARTMILAGTPGGTVFKGLYPSAYARGLASWLLSGLRGGIAPHVVEAHIAAAKSYGDYLQPGSIVTIEADKMGALANRIE